MHASLLRPISCLPLLGVLALATEADGAPVAERPSALPSAAPASTALPPGALIPLVTKQSIYIPCYAFVPVTGQIDDWDQGRSECHTMEKNQGVGLVAPLHLPVTAGKLRIDSLRCYSYSDTAGDRIEYSAHVFRGNTSLAVLDVVQNKGDTAEDGVDAKPGFDLDPTKEHYDVSISWKVVVPAGEGWLPKDNQFRGCRVDYKVFATL